MKKVFIGIDFSKLTFDASLFHVDNQGHMAHCQFTNDVAGYARLLVWVKKQGCKDISLWLFCGEHTGLYSYQLTDYLNARNIDIWLESALQIKRSMGIVREKTDKIDSANIALYAKRFEDRARSSKLRAERQDEIKDLLAYRERLTKIVSMIKVSAKELKRVKKNASVDYIFKSSQHQIEDIENELKEIDKQIKELLKSDKELHDNCQLLMSIKGIGLQNAAMMLVLTENFSLFSDPRKFACYCGVVPFKQSSGTSVKKNDKVSGLANKKMKVLLSNAAQSAIRHNPQIRAYANRKLQEGKNKHLVANNVKNKLIHLMFAVVKNRTAYDLNYRYLLEQAG